MNVAEALGERGMEKSFLSAFARSKMPHPMLRLCGVSPSVHKDLWRRGGVNVSSSVREGNDPEHQFTFQSIVDLPANFQFDVSGRYVNTLPSPKVPEYFTLDARLAWQYKDVEISLVGQNLTESRHREFGTQEIPRAVYGKVTLRF